MAWSSVGRLCICATRLQHRASDLDDLWVFRKVSRRTFERYLNHLPSPCSLWVRSFRRTNEWAERIHAALTSSRRNLLNGTSNTFVAQVVAELKFVNRPTEWWFTTSQLLLLQLKNYKVNVQDLVSFSSTKCYPVNIISMEHQSKEHS